MKASANLSPARPSARRLTWSALPAAALLLGGAVAGCNPQTTRAVSTETVTYRVVDPPPVRTVTAPPPGAYQIVEPAPVATRTVVPAPAPVTYQFVERPYTATCTVAGQPVVYRVAERADGERVAYLDRAQLLEVERGRAVEVVRDCEYFDSHGRVIDRMRVVERRY